MNDYLDSVSTKIYYQHTEAHDWTYMPDSVTRRMQTVNSNYDTDTWGLQTALAKTLGRHDLSAGFNASTSKTQRPFSQSPIPSVYSEIMQPEADSRSYTLGGFVQIRSTSISTATTSPLFPACAWCINRLSRKICPISPPTAAC